MASSITAPRGTRDMLPDEGYQWHYIEKTVAEVAQAFGFQEIRVPTFEHTELFARGVGDTTDVVQKEMYTFADKGGRSITLRPEGTAGTARAAIEHALFSGALPVGLYYALSCFRYEKPQAGRLREFHQFGVELFGTKEASADAMVISLAGEVFRRLGVKGLALEINSIGCPTCRAAYLAALRAYFSQYRDQLCATCQSRLESNPMRILDCKSPVCGEIARKAPVILDYLCADCQSHFEKLKHYLTLAGFAYQVNPRIVRGLDYYTRTVFEFVCDAIGAQGTVCGGGRYDGLICELGGPEMPGLGFGMGLERLIAVMKAQGLPFGEQARPALYLAGLGEAAVDKAFELASMLRAHGVQAVHDVMNRSLKAQMKYANKIGARYTLVIGEEELARGAAVLKDMDGGENTPVKLEAPALLAAIGASSPA